MVTLPKLRPSESEFEMSLPWRSVQIKTLDYWILFIKSFYTIIFYFCLSDLQQWTAFQNWESASATTPLAQRSRPGHINISGGNGLCCSCLRVKLLMFKTCKCHVWSKNMFLLSKDFINGIGLTDDGVEGHWTFWSSSLPLLDLF